MPAKNLKFLRKHSILLRTPENFGILKSETVAKKSVPEKRGEILNQNNFKILPSSEISILENSESQKSELKFDSKFTFKPLPELDLKKLQFPSFESSIGDQNSSVQTAEIAKSKNQKPLKIRKKLPDFISYGSLDSEKFSTQNSTNLENQAQKVQKESSLDTEIQWNF